MSASLHFVLPEGIEEVDRASGGNRYDRRLCDGLRAMGWEVHEHPVAGQWPQDAPDSLEALGGLLAELSDGALVLLDGIIASGAPAPLEAQAGRLRLVVLAHMLFGAGPEGTAETRGRERAALRAAAAVITTSRWSRSRAIELYDLPAPRVHAVPPGVDPAAPAPGSGGGGSLLCVATVSFVKGQDILVEALARIPEHPWSCLCVGSTSRQPSFARLIARRTRDLGLDRRVRFAGAQGDPELAGSYAGADLLVAPSRAESYGMAVSEALARGLPVLAADVGGLPEALGGEGIRPGLLVAPADPQALAQALQAWLEDPDLRLGLRAAASARRESLPGWSETAAAVAAVLERVRR